MNPHPALEQRTRAFVAQLLDITRRAGHEVVIPTTASIFSTFFADRPPRNFDDVMQTRKELYIKLFKALLDQGVYLPPSPYEVSFLSIAHDDAVLNRTLEAWAQAVATLQIS